MSNKMFVHEEAYRGKEFVQSLAGKHITLCGAGALGSNLCDSLARQGAQKLRVIDFDRVEIHNVHTQTYSLDDVGMQKVQALKNHIYRAVHLEIETHDKKLVEDNCKKFFKNTDIVVDLFDNSESRRLVQNYCRANKVACLHAGMFEDYGEVVWDEIYNVPKNTVDGDVCDYPLARNLVTFVVSLTSELLLCYIGNKEKRSVSFTLRDFVVAPYR